MLSLITVFLNPGDLLHGAKRNRGAADNRRCMTFAHYEFARGASIHEHFHPQKELYEVIEGELENDHRRRAILEIS